ncbi:hypothetical protein MalM25_01260 [Planctomycetes bacterium MalM25]|nr:hypothetical protein MalM25_01260 [Planctomycetes bacterium MalM25]
MASNFDPSVYGAAIAQAIGVEPTMPLDAGEADRSQRDALEVLSAEVVLELEERTPIIDQGAFECCLAGVWLLHGFLDEAHAICQDVPSASGSYWHGVMHRREGDHWNADYWFRRAGDHPAGARIASAAVEHPETVEAALGGRWDPHRFNELVKQAKSAGGPLEAACLAVQRAEWRALFDHDWRRAIGG